MPEYVAKCLKYIYFIYGLFASIHDPLLVKCLPSWRTKIMYIFSHSYTGLEKPVWYCFS